MTFFGGDNRALVSFVGKELCHSTPRAMVELPAPKPQKLMY